MARTKLKARSTPRGKAADAAVAAAAGAPSTSPAAARWSSTESSAPSWPATSWIGHKGAASTDLRSEFPPPPPLVARGQAVGNGAWRSSTDIGTVGDTMTTPTAAMLEAIVTCTLRDDVFEEDDSTSSLERHVAELAGMEAGLFVLSGTMGNQLAMRSLLTQPPYSVLCDHRSHIVQYEAGGLTGAHVKTVVPGNARYLTLEDIEKSVVLSDDVHACPTRVISLENTLNGVIMPLAEARRIAAFARAHGIRLHCDGARLWEAVASGAGALPDFCRLFDTVSLCFSKGLGAPVGSVLVGSAPTLRHARWVRKSIGGGLRQPGLLTAAARVAVDQTFGTSPDGQQGLLRLSHDVAKKVEALWTDRGGTLVHPVETNMCWLDLDAAGCSAQRFEELGREQGLTIAGNRLVTHYQIAQNADDVLPRLQNVFEKVFAEGGSGKTEHEVGVKSMYQTKK
ncbi:hypothetical protein S7711_08951 [Stachybotrys chartarum IBT 7711]|uniref:Aromatic amino acid beta-eliminating lyase/threonine aldolase domain-containing protein n=1 Tax=Stachybotrys chartarum (strain CBS 109288 / IBT 7711) TaxID=1280523 RepID=A0A084AYI4_STACB|nr:hypothetical protein S7711_08951 [Stachybotrys chartarum IBT 7711]